MSEEVELKAPEGKFKVIAWVEDMDCIDPIDDWPVEKGICDTMEQAKELASKEYAPFSPTVIYDDKGNCHRR